MIKGVGERMSAYLAKLNIHTIQDLLFHLPTRYLDRTRISPIGSLRFGEYAVVEGHVAAVKHQKIAKTKLICQLSDGTGTLNLRFFFVHAQQIRSFQSDALVRCYGEIRRGQYGLELVHPEYKILDDNTELDIEENLTPIYATTEGVSQQALRKLTDAALAMLQAGGCLDELLPAQVLAAFKFPALAKAIVYVHRPPKNAPVELLLAKQHIAQQRLMFEELVAHRLSLLNLKQSFQHQAGYAFKLNNEITQKFLDNLSFTLTGAQQRVVAEIFADLVKSQPMLRLVQGDVGSGKTVVATLALLQAVANHFQAALLAPTELLAEQHYRSLKAWLTPLNISVALLTGQLKGSIRKEILQNMASGDVKVVVGTHAIFQKHVAFKQLALVIVDEQHRFGVEQRALLREKGVNGLSMPHQLVMTATPIPRTLAMSAYADLDYSVIDELPPGRTPINTLVVPNNRRDEIMQKIETLCSEGKQAYWVCTLIEESETLQCQAAEKTAEYLNQVFPHLKIGLLHGKIKSSQKDIIMQAFKQGELQLLVATTVIEVGVDVPNASLMVIENAERLGLAQLHQLRGRIGRGTIASHCILMYQAPLSQHGKMRLSVMRETTDGFKIAQKDLEIRGPGEVLGTRQTGDMGFRLADLVRDESLFPKVQAAADILLKDYPAVVPALIKRWLQDAARFGQV